MLQRFVIERDLPNAGQLTASQLRNIATTSNGVLAEMGPGIQWEHSYVTSDRIYCVYLAETEEQIRVHALKGNFPCTEVNRVTAVIDPLTAGARAA